MTLTHSTTRGFALLTLLILPLIARADRSGAAQDDTATTQLLLWKATHNGAVAYLYGSIHLGREDYFPLHPTIMRAFNESEVLGVEASLDSMREPEVFNAVRQLSTLPPEQSLRDALTSQTWNALRDYCEELSLPIAGFLSMRPATVMMQLEAYEYMRAGMDPTHGVDMHLMNLAKARETPIWELEGLVHQLKLFHALPAETVEAMLLDMATNYDEAKTRAEILRLERNWIRGDDQGFAKMFKELRAEGEEAEEFFKKLLVDRNKTMARKTREWMRPGAKLFIVVGAGHLCGPNSVQDELRQAGVQVERVAP